MRILYLSVSYVPSRSASSVHAMKMCAALARAGHAVQLVTKDTPARLEPGIEDDFGFYGVAENFELLKLPRPEPRGGGIVYLRAVRRLLTSRDVDLVYSRDLTGAQLAARAGHRVIFEAHGRAGGFIARRVARRLVARPELVRLVFISQALEDLWRADGLLDGVRSTVIAHDACDPIPGLTPAAAETPERLRAGYVGHLYSGRGVELIIEVSRRLPAIDFIFVGGSERDVKVWRARDVTPNVEFLGFMPPSRLAAVYSTFDLLLMPYQRSVSVRSGRSDTARWMSPMKMFEYLAAGRAIVSSDLPVLREVLRDEENSLLADPQDPDAWTGAIERLAADSGLRTRLGQRGQELFLARHTWDARARDVLGDLAP